MKKKGKKKGLKFLKKIGRAVGKTARKAGKAIKKLGKQISENESGASYSRNMGPNAKVSLPLLPRLGGVMGGM
tara:strand:+ start:585 stop:803 length:219 start_codon:yes stop_codon:yes gene_type:complete